MIIGVDGCCWSNRRGFGRFTRQLIRKLVEIDGENTYILFVDSDTATIIDLPNQIDVVTANTKKIPTDAASASGNRSLGDIWSLTRTVSRVKVDVFFFPAVYSYFPIINRTKILVTVHDAIADRHPQQTFADRRHLYYWKAKQHLALRQADQILTVSEYSKKIICDYFNLLNDSVSVATEAASSTFGPIDDERAVSDTLEKYGLQTSDPFLLYVGGISPHKNLSRLISAFDQLEIQTASSNIKLVLVGDYENDSFFSDYENLQSQVRELGIEDRVLFTGYVPDSDLVHLYNFAEALTFPSLEEGFGLPAIEAMACGTPVIASDRGSLPEVLGGAGRLFDPTDVNSIRMVIQDVLIDESIRRDMTSRGLVRSLEFTWDEAARKTIQVFNQLCGV